MTNICSGFRSIAFFSALSCLSLSCFLGGAREDSAILKRFTPATPGAQYPTVPPEQVQRYWAPDAESLPEGVTAGRGDSPAQVAVDPNYPSARDPHRLVGVLSIGSSGLPTEKAALQALFAGEVGQLGGNAYLELSARSNYTQLIVLRLSTATPDAVYPAAAELLAQPIPELGQYQPSGTPMSRRLDAFEPFVVQGEPGHCYAVRAALESNAMLNRLARRALRLRVEHSAAAIDAKGSTSKSHAPISLRTMTAVVGCPTGSGPIKVTFNVGFNSNNPEAWRTLGTGEVQFQLYERTIPVDELQQRATREATESRIQEDRSRSQFRSRQCLSCAGQLAFCRSGTDPANCSPYVQCLFRKGMRPEDCY